MHLNYLNQAADGEFLALYFKGVFKKIMFIKSLEFRIVKLNSEHLLDLAKLKANEILRMKYLF